MEIKRLSEGTETWKPPVIDASGRIVREERRSEAEIPYLVIDPTNKEAAIRAVLSATPREAGSGLTLSGLRFDEFVDDNALRCTALYSSGSFDSGSDYEDEAEDADGDDSESRLSVSLSTATVHITRAIRQWRAGGVTDNMGGMIGWNGQSGEQADFAGVDVPVGQCSIQYKKRRRVKNLKPAFAIRCANAMGKANLYAWRGWPAGSLMFNSLNYDIPRGASGERKVTCTWDFSFSPGGTQNINGYNVTKAGWEYAWGVPPTAGTGEILRPYISQVIELVDFDILGV